MPRRQPQKGPGRPLRGWISALDDLYDHDDRQELEKMGIEVGRYNEENMRFENCVVPRPAIHLLVSSGDRFMPRSLK